MEKINMSIEGDSYILADGLHVSQSDRDNYILQLISEMNVEITNKLDFSIYENNPIMVNSFIADIQKDSEDEGYRNFRIEVEIDNNKITSKILENDSENHIRKWIEDHDTVFSGEFNLNK
ncbi:MAG: hypothetical protein GY932_06925 [Arcobacter sp.]|nr:hypothetical protein [Arcobacter sp.]